MLISNKYCNCGLCRHVRGHMYISYVLFWWMQSQSHQNAKFSLTGEKHHTRYIIGIHATGMYHRTGLSAIIQNLDVECKPLSVKAHIENSGSNVWMLMLGKPCNERIDLINTQNNQYWFVIVIRNNIGALTVDKRDPFILYCVCTTLRQN